jgi:hypothetical protein
VQLIGKKSESRKSEQLAVSAPPDSLPLVKFTLREKPPQEKNLISVF